jgi:hypothetical protein
MNKKIIFITSITFLFIINSFTTPKIIYSNIGVILGDIVNIRIAPSITSQVIGSVKENDFVKIIERTNIKETIGQFNDKWLKIKTEKGIIGFIFGAFIFDIEKLYLFKWTQPNYARPFITTVIFYKNNTYSRLIENVSGIEQESRNINSWFDYKENGTFLINGRKLIFSPINKFIRQKEPKLSNWRKANKLSDDFIQTHIYKILYLYKCANENGLLLTKKLISSNINAFCADYGGYHTVK